MAAQLKRGVAAVWMAMFVAGATINAANSDDRFRQYTSGLTDRQEFAARVELKYLFDRWIAATNARDLEAQAAFYPDTMEAFYLWRHVPQAAVIAEKRRVFGRADVVQISAEAPLIIIEPGGVEARMYFRKSYVIKSSQQMHEGEVLQELRWRKIDEQWKIASERDIRVLS